MFDSVQPYIQPLGSGLTLRSVATREDVERLAAFNGLIHDASVESLTRDLILHHPATRPDHWPFIQDDASGEIVSALCLIPWTWRYEDVDLRAGEMGICGTRDGYRHRGLVRALMARHKALLREGEYHLSHIQGIPYFYRQFGYEYALPLEGGWEIDLYRVPDAPPPDSPPYRFRPTGLDDLPALVRLYDDAARDLAIYAVRSEAEWRYLLTDALRTGTAADTWLVIDGAGQIAGYWRIQHFGFGEGLNVAEVSRLDHAAAVALLSQLKAQAVKRQKPYIRLILPPGTALIQTARSMGARDTGTYSWQIHLPDVPRLLRQIAPVLERRVAASPFAGLTQTVLINLYREAFTLRFEAGRLLDVSSAGFVDGGEMRIPPLLFAPLVLGWRTWRELRQTYPDVGVWGQSAPLADVLFPRMESYIYTNY